MSSTSSDIDADIQSAFAGQSTPTTDPIDDDVASAFSQDNASGSRAAKGDTSAQDQAALESDPSFGEAVLHAASGGLSTMLGGFRYAMGADRPLSEEQIARNKASLVYEPRTEGGKQAAAAIDTAGSYTGATEGKWLGPRATDAATALGLPPSIAGGIGAAAETAANVPQFLVPTAMRGAGRALRGAEAEVPTPRTAQEVVNQEAAKQSTGAAGAGIDVSKLTPETQAEIASAGHQKLPLNQTALSRHAVAESLPVPQRLTRGMATGEGPLISEEVNSRRTNPEIGAHLDDLNQGLTDNIDELRRQAAPQAVGNNRIQNDQAMVDSLKDIHLGRKAEWKKEYASAEQANGGPVQLDGSSALAAADTALKKQSRFKLLPQSVQGVLDEIRENNGHMSLDDLEGYRTTMATAARSAERSPDGGNVSHAIGLARDAIEKNVQMQPGASTIAKQHYDAARKMVAADYAERGVNPAYDAAVNDVAVTKRGQRSDLSGTFGDKYIIGGSSANLQRLRTLFGDDEPAQQTMTAVGLNHLRESAGIKPEETGGNFSQHGYNSAWSYDVAPRAAELLRDPEIIEHAQNIGKVAAWEQQRSKSQYVNSSNTAVADRPSTAAIKTGVGTLAEAGAEMLPGVARGALKLGKGMLKSSQEAKAVAAAEAQRQQFVRETTKPGAGLTYQKP